MKILFVPSLLLLITACTPSSQEKQTESETVAVQTPSIKKVWASDTLLRTPEAVLYDKERAVVYVANINENPWGKDGNGFISKMDLKGNITNLHWVEGLSAPKGMGVVGNSLFVADIDEVVEIDINQGSILNRYVVEGTPTLNDITVHDGKVYISGSDSNKVFELKDGKVVVILEGDFGRPNGLFAEADRLLMITSNSSQLKSFDWATQQPTVLVDSLGHGDGIVPVGNGDYLASSWKGELFYITSDWKRIQLLDTREAAINAADIDYVISQNLLLVPTFFDNRVVAYELIQ